MSEKGKDVKGQERRISRDSSREMTISRTVPGTS